MGVKGKWQRGLMSKKLFLKECVMTLPTSTPVFHKESKLICHI